MSKVSLLFKYKIGLRTIFMYVVRGCKPKCDDNVIVAPTRDNTGYYVIVDDKDENEIKNILG